VPAASARAGKKARARDTARALAAGTGRLRPAAAGARAGHSDGCRADNKIVRRPPSGTRHYSYPRYFFSNTSDDIRRILTDALDALGIAWRTNNPNSVSIARREAVAALDAFVGPKS
jgi:hypothetical protein